MKKVAVIEDDTDLLTLLKYNLEREPFRVVTASKGDGALEWYRKTYQELANRINGVRGSLVALTPRRWQFREDPEKIGEFQRWYAPDAKGRWEDLDTTVNLTNHTLTASVTSAVDALGGEMAKITDRAGIQFRMLNLSKGPAVWSLRAQATFSTSASRAMARPTATSSGLVSGTSGSTARASC